MGSALDVAFGRLAIQHGLVSQEAVRAAFQQLPPGRTLGDELVRRGQLHPERAAQLTAWLRTHASPSGSFPAAQPAPDDGATLRGPAAAFRPSQSAPDDGATLRGPPAAFQQPQPAPDDGATLRGPASTAGASRAPSADRLPDVGEVVGGYVLDGLLGKGGMGAVFRGRDPGTGAQVALKVLLPGADPDGSALARFRREAEAVAKVDAHAGIVRVRGLGSHRGMPFAVMDMVQGRDLHAAVKDGGALEVERALRYTEAVARAVQHCHDKGVLHRDLKPANVLLRAEDDTPLVMDFGLALDQDAERLTRTGEVMGTPAYMSPEQAEGDKTAVDARTDVYALGAILFELVTGRAPFQGQPFEIIKKVFLDMPPPVGELVEGVPADVDVIVRKAMAKDKALRYESAGALADDVARLRRGEPITARAPTRREELEWRARRGDVRARLVLRAPRLAALVVLTIVAVVTLNALRSTPAKRLSAVLERLGPALRDDGPLSRTSTTDDVVHELVGLAPVGSDDLSRLTALAALGDGAPPELEELAAVLQDQPERRLLLRRLVRRLAVTSGRDDPSGLPLPTTPDQALTAEDHLMGALRLAGWGRVDVTLETATVAPPLADLEALLDGAVKASGEARRTDAASANEEEALESDAEALRRKLRSVDEAVVAALDGGRDALVARVRAAFASGPPRGPPTWPVEAPVAEDGALTAHALGVLRREKARSLEQALGSIRKLVAEVDERRWGRDRGPYDVLAGAYLDGFAPFAFAPPRTPDALSAGTAALLEDVGRRATEATAGPELLEGYVGLLQAAQPFVGAMEDAFQTKAFDAVFHSMRTSLERGERPPLSTVMLLPALRRLPTARASFEPFFRRAIEQREIDTWVKEHKRGDGYLVWGEVLGRIRDNDARGDLALMETMRQKYAAGLGERLDAATRGRLRLDPATPLTVPMTEFWVPRALMRVAVLTARCEALQGERPPSREVVDATLELMRPLLEGPAVLADEPAEHQKVVHEVGDCLEDLSEALAAREADWGAALAREAEAALRVEVELGRRIARAAASAERREGFEEGSMAGADARHNDEHLSQMFEDPVNGLVRFLQRRERLSEGRELMSRELTFYRSLGPALPLPFTLLLGRAAFALDDGDLGVADASAREVLAEVEARPGNDPKTREDRAKHASAARSTLAIVLARRGDVAGAKALFEAARSDGEPLQRYYWPAVEAAIRGR